MTRDEVAIVRAINEALREGWALPVAAFGRRGRRPLVRVERALGWRMDGRLLVAVHDAGPHYCPAQDCRWTYALGEADWSKLLEELTSKDWVAPGEAILRGGRLA